MDAEELKKEIQQYLDKFKELDINDYRHEQEEMNILNPYFGYLDECRGGTVGVDGCP